MRSRLFFIGRRSGEGLTVEDIVGGKMYQVGVGVQAQFRQSTRALGIHLVSRLGLGFGPINRVIGGGVDDHIGTMLVKGGAQLSGVG